jgi:hypothetical protein
MTGATLTAAGATHRVRTDRRLDLVDSDGRSLGSVERLLYDSSTNRVFWALVCPSRSRRFSRQVRAWMPIHDVATATEDGTLQVPFGFDELADAGEVVQPDDNPQNALEELRTIYGRVLDEEVRSELLAKTDEAWPGAPPGAALKETRQGPKIERNVASKPSPSLPDADNDGESVAGNVRPLSDEKRQAIVARARRELPQLTDQARDGIRELRKIASR